MFTGLIEEIGVIQGVGEKTDGRILTVAAKKVIEGTAVGDSIAINGACQTVTGISGETFSVFVSKVTSGITTLGTLKKDSRANLERAMTPGSRFGGHIVQGHVDETGIIKSIKKDSTGVEVWVNAGKNIMKYVVNKGSITIDGISLTVVEAGMDSLALYLIPETIGNTLISEWKEGHAVNIEVDILAKYVEKMLHSSKGSGIEDSVLMKKLSEEGFLS